MNTTTTTRPKYVGIIDMGPNYRAPYWDGDAYVWDTLEDVRASVRSIRNGHGVAARVAEWDDDGAARAGALDDSLTPCADDVSILILRNGADALTLAETDGAAFGRIVR